MTEEKNTVEKSETRKAADPEIEPGEVVEEELVEGAKVRRKGIYLLPNALTTASLFSGFYAIVSAANGVFDNAAIAILNCKWSLADANFIIAIFQNIVEIFS